MVVLPIRHRRLESHEPVLVRPAISRASGRIMPKKKKTKQRGNRRTEATRNVKESLRLAAESRTAMSVTVAWTLTLMATLAAEALGFFCQLYVRFVAENEVLTVLGAVMLFVALTSGCVTLLLTPLATRIAKTKPPRLIVQVAYIAGGLPIATLLLQYFAGL